jgi:outer membrane lipoprotein SlyB
MKQTLIAVLCIASLLAGCAERRSTTSSSYPAPSGSTLPQSDQGPVYSSSDASSGQIPAGTQIVIRTMDDINVASIDQTRDYDAQIDREVLSSDGSVLIPVRSPVKLSVFSTGNNELELGVRSITINGQNYSVNTDTEKRAQREGLGKNRRTATMVGGGALLGTLIGAVAGGAKGAVIGAATGAAVGAGAQIATRGKEVKVPAESQLTFKLDDPIYLQGYRQ